MFRKPRAVSWFKKPQVPLFRKPPPVPTMTNRKLLVTYIVALIIFVLIALYYTAVVNGNYGYYDPYLFGIIVVGVVYALLKLLRVV